MELDVGKNVELIQKMQTWKGRKFAKKNGIPLYSLEPKITDNEINNFLKKWFHTSFENNQNFILPQNQFENEICRLLPRKQINFSLEKIKENFKGKDYLNLTKKEQGCATYLKLNLDDKETHGFVSISAINQT